MFFKQLKAVFKNSYKVCTGDPFYLVISLTMIIVMALAASMPSIGNEHERLVRDQTHSILFMCGALAAAFGLIRVVTDEIRRGAGSILMSRPVSGMTLMAGKLLGVLAAVFVIFLIGGSTSLWISEINKESEMINLTSFLLFVAAIIASLGAGAARQYMFGTSFSKYTGGALAFFLTVGVTLRYFMGNSEHFDLMGLQSILLIFLAVAVFASVVLVFAVIADSALVLGFSVVIFFFGLLSEYLCTTVVGGGLGKVMASVLPNWQLFWVLERIGAGEQIPFSYFLTCGVHALLLIFLYLNAAVIFFDRAEIKGVA